MVRPDPCGRERGVEIDEQPSGDLRKANRQLREFLALVAHELFSPLAAIRSALCLLEQQGDNAATRERVRNVMDRQTMSIGRMVEDLLDASRIEHGKLRLSKQTVDLSRTVTHAVETAHNAIKGRGHQLEVSLPSEPVCLDADPARIEQMLTNLLTNAAKYTEPGGCIWLTADVQNDEVVFQVRDSGIGIAPEMLPHVFDPFWQAERTLHRAQGGLGIGLSLVRSVAELHGGSASVHSEGLGHGSEFVVRVPVGTTDERVGPSGPLPTNNQE